MDNKIIEDKISAQKPNEYVSLCCTVSKTAHNCIYY